MTGLGQATGHHVYGQHDRCQGMLVVLFSNPLGLCANVIITPRNVTPLVFEAPAGHFCSPQSGPPYFHLQAFPPYWKMGKESDLFSFAFVVM